MDKTVVGLFDTTDAAQRAVSEIIDLGIARDDVSLVARHADNAQAVGDTADGAAAGAGVGAATGGVLGLLVGLGALAIPGIGPIIAAGPLAAAIGTAAAAVTGTAIGAVGGAAVGGLLGALVDAGVPEEHANLYSEGVRRGGTLLVVHAPETSADRVQSIMTRNGAVDVNKRGENWRREGWSRFDPNADPGKFGDNKWEESSKVGTAGGTIAGATTGAAIGAAGGPVGAVVGGLAGAAVGAGVGAAADSAGEALEDSTFDPDYRQHYNTYYGTTGRSYETYRPYYNYGYTLASDPLYRDRDWATVEPEARRRWEMDNPTPWEDIKDSVRYAWDKVRGRR